MPTTTNKRQETYNKEFLDAACNGDLETVQAMLKKRLVYVDDTCALYRASEAGHLRIVQELIRVGGADVNMSHAVQARGCTALHAACNYAHSTEVVQELLNAGANVDTPNWCGLTALLQMLDSHRNEADNRTPIARLLVEAKCNVNLCVRDTTALFLSCDEDVPNEIFTLIVESGANLTARDSHGLTALHRCMHQKFSHKKINCLLKNGINVNAKNNSGETALHIAAASKIKVIPLLLHYNANVLLRTNENETALMKVLCNGKITVENQFMIVRMILAKMNPCDRFGLDLQNDAGWTALHYAAKGGSQQIIHELLNWKPDVTHRTDKDRRTALHTFINSTSKYANNVLDVLRCLVEHENGYCTDAINLQDYEGCTALHLALEKDFSDPILHYLSNAVDVSIPDRSGETSLHTALQKQKAKELILTMLGSTHGTEVTKIQNSRGMTALHMTICQNGTDNKEIVPILSRMTNVNAQDRYGKTALHYVVQKGAFDALNILLYEQKADPSIQDCDGNTPLSLACELPMENDSSQLSFILQLYQYGVAYGANMV